MSLLSVEKLKNDILENKLTNFDYFLYLFFSLLFPFTIMVIVYVVLYNNFNVTVEKKMDRYIRKFCAIYFSSSVRFFIIYFFPLYIIRFMAEKFAGIEINQDDELIKIIAYAYCLIFIAVDLYIVAKNYQDLTKRYFAKKNLATPS